MRIVTWNILATGYIKSEYYPGIATEFLDPARRDPSVVQRVNAFGADVLCLQEVEAGMYEQLEKTLTERGYAGAFAPRGGRRPDGCALFVKTALGTIRSARAILYPDGSGHLAQRVEVQTRSGLLVIVNTHLKWDPDHASKPDRVGYHQAEFARELLDAGHCDERLELLCGDFNVAPDDELLTLLREAGFVDPFAELDHASVFFANQKPRRIDYVLVRGPATAVARPYSPLPEEFSLPSEEEPSDHLPLEVELTWSEAG